MSSAWMRQLAGAGAEEIAAHANVVAQVKQLVKGKTFFADEVQLHVDLQPLAALLEMRKAGLALQANRDDAPGDFYRNTRIFQLLGCLLAVFSQNLRDGVGKGELVRIGLLAQGFNLGKFLPSQVVDFFFSKTLLSFASVSVNVRLYLSEVPKRSKRDRSRLKQIRWRMQAASKAIGIPHREDAVATDRETARFDISPRYDKKNASAVVPGDGIGKESYSRSPESWSKPPARPSSSPPLTGRPTAT